MVEYWVKKKKTRWKIIIDKISMPKDLEIVNQCEEFFGMLDIKKKDGKT
jgi:hypothetical protein